MDHSSSGLPRNMPFNLLAQITDGFSSERKLGSGGFGEVYTGVGDDGVKIAVKMLHDMPLDDKQFLNESNNLARLRHPNIVRLVGFCFDVKEEIVEYNGREVLAHRTRRLLCMEHMHSGSLKEYLSGEGCVFDWSTCYTLIKGICEGLKYLHEDSAPAICHLDLKPANILLDENMLPKIADFGLSRLFADTWITKDFVGTLGYVPPEFIMRKIISKKFDIFSLGVVIIEIVTGRMGYNLIDEMSPQQFVERAHERWRNKLQKTPSHLFNSYSKQVKTCVEIGLRCVVFNRNERPSIGDIIKQLNKTDTDQGMSTTKVNRCVHNYELGRNISGGTFAKVTFTDEAVAINIQDKVKALKHKMVEQGMRTTKVNRCVGKYELGHTTSKGTFAKVRFARDLVTGEAVAIKILDKEKVLKHKMVEQVKRGISTMKLIKHPNVVRIYEVMGSKTKIYIVLEFTHDELLDKIVNHGRMREDEARRYFQQLINAVDYCHSRGVYHRDLKPENLLLDSYGNLKVSDFGLSALSQQMKDDGLLHTTCGTPNYVAPEVLEDQGYDGAMADLWSCGVILFVLLAGYLPFEDSNLMTLYKKISNAEYTLPPWTSFPAKRLLTRILDPNPMTRITIPEILEDEWFRKGYKRPGFDEKYDTMLDDVDAAFNDSEELHVTEKKEEPVALNAFELISMSPGLNLGNLFDSEQEFKTETTFTSKCPPKEIVCKIEEAAKPLGFDVHKKNYKLRLEKVKAGRMGTLNVAIEILKVAPSLHMVEVRKAKGDTLEFHKFYKNLSKTIKDVIWKSDDIETVHSS